MISPEESTDASAARLPHKRCRADVTAKPGQENESRLHQIELLTKQAQFTQRK